jgi:hypothetical protein
LFILLRCAATLQRNKEGDDSVDIVAFFFILFCCTGKKATAALLPSPSSLFDFVALHYKEGDGSVFFILMCYNALKKLSSPSFFFNFAALQRCRRLLHCFILLRCAALQHKEVGDGTNVAIAFFFFFILLQYAAVQQRNEKGDGNNAFLFCCTAPSFLFCFVFFPL